MNSEINQPSNVDTNKLLAYERHLENTRRANKKYREANREKLKQIAKNYYDAHKNDEEFKEKLREKARKHYEKKKLTKPEFDPNTTLMVLQI